MLDPQLTPISMLGFKSKKDEVLNHWISFADNFTLPSQEFYKSLEKELTDRNVPGLTISQVEYAEGGLLSEQRIYLRLIRERLAFDACAAPFGTGYFFSCRTVYSPVVVKLWHILVGLGFFGGLYLFLAKYLGIIFAAIAVGTLVIAIAQVNLNICNTNFTQRSYRHLNSSNNSSFASDEIGNNALTARDSCDGGNVLAAC